MAQSIIDGEEVEAALLATRSIKLDIVPLDAIIKGYIVSVNQVGEAFSCGDAFLLELVMVEEKVSAYEIPEIPLSLIKELKDFVEKLAKEAGLDELPVVDR